MKKVFLLFAASCFILSACVPDMLKPQATSPAPAPISEADIQATVAVQVAQTLQALPTPTLAPSNTPVVATATSAPTQTQTQPMPTVTATGTQNPTLLTLTATLGTGTVTLTAGTAGTLPFTATSNLSISGTVTGTPYYQYAGTMPPDLPFGNISLINMSKTAASISLRCETKDGYVTYIDYPLGGSTVDDSIPAGSYTYVAWVGGREFSNRFKLDKFQDLKFIIYKDRIEIK
jgi:hypothetical protein